MTSLDADRERLLRIAHAGLLAWRIGDLITVSDGVALTAEDGELASRLTHEGLLSEAPSPDGLVYIGITERGEHVLAGDEMDVACSGTPGWERLVLILAFLATWILPLLALWSVLRGWS